VSAAELRRSVFEFSAVIRILCKIGTLPASIPFEFEECLWGYSLVLFAFYGLLRVSSFLRVTCSYKVFNSIFQAPNRLPSPVELGGHSSSSRTESQIFVSRRGLLPLNGSQNQVL
jgi:hypothetical protein